MVCLAANLGSSVSGLRPNAFFRCDECRLVYAGSGTSLCGTELVFCDGLVRCRVECALATEATILSGAAQIGIFHFLVGYGTAVPGPVWASRLDMA